ncbi:MAG: glycosyltransferase family 2 protein [Streptosporangiaceae bacterium]
MTADTRAGLSHDQVGSLLVDRGLITRQQLDWALGAQQRTGSPLSVILITAGLVRRQQLYQVLGEIWHAPYIDLVAEPPDRRLLAGLNPDFLVRAGWLPVRSLADGRVLVAGPHPPAPGLLESIEETLGAPVAYKVTTDWDIRYALQHSLRDVILDRAALGLWRRSEPQSARRILFRGQQAALVLAAAAAIAAFVLAPLASVQVLVVVVGLLFMAGVAFKFAVCMTGARRERHEAVTGADVAALRDEDLPTYTVLAPLYREANVIGDLIANLAQLDYPVDKLDVLLLLEEDDAETIAAAKAAGLPQWMSLILVPQGAPQTKPKACNVGLFFARGEYLVIFDAEDRPDHDQLKKAVIAFSRGSDRMVCVQAALNYWNVYENFLTRMFTAEYSFWFDYMLPGLDALRLPIPLGGTSNHFRTDALRRLGGWDPFNVTEDADLGIRASALGYTVGVVNSTTYEEANRAGGNWIRQRSRWIKGYMQTVLVHTRHPLSLLRVTGLRQTLGFLLLIAGTPLTFLFVLPLYALFFVSLLAPEAWFAQLFPGWVLWVGLVNLIAGNGLMIYICMMGAFKRRRYPLVLWALLNPVYWIMHSIASYKALWQLITRPHYWEKTAHGISTIAAQAPVPGTEPAS